MKTKTLTTKRLTLRPYEEGDIVAWQRWDTDPDIQEYLPEPLNEPVTDGEQLAYLKECLEEEDGIYWTIVFNETREVIGTISLNDISTYHGVAEINTIIGEKEYWGKGVATEATQAVLTYAKKELKLRRIMGEFEADNKGVEKVLRANGFVEECCCKASRMKRGKPIDTIRYYILFE
jgi:ribosomal-protein-alanine N-acetyltransferase